MSDHGIVTKRKSSLAYLFLAIALAALYASGCSSTAGIEATVDRRTVYHEEVVIHNPKLAKKIYVEELKSTLVGDLLKANVRVRSSNKKTLEIQYKYSWFDENGFEIDPDTDAWTPVTIYGKEAKTLPGVAPNPGAKAFKILIRGL